MFLPFGTIAPGLLLSLLGFAYMLFFGTYALNKVTADDQPDKPGKRIHADRSVSSASAAKTFYFPSPDDSHEALAQEAENTAGKEPTACLVIEVPDENLTQNPHPFRYFARPPPVTTTA
ncbi:MAG: hypothetical protein QUS66_07765 [Bacteroidota bacterium]|nr:hypothetical protein [Bacteroidota bacterium]